MGDVVFTRLGELCRADLVQDGRAQSAIWHDLNELMDDMSAIQQAIKDAS